MTTVWRRLFDLIAKKDPGDESRGTPYRERLRGSERRPERRGCFAGGVRLGVTDGVGVDAAGRLPL
jgi:hypothetical protein